MGRQSGEQDDKKGSCRLKKPVMTLFFEDAGV